MNRSLFSALAFVAAVVSATDASAFCRTTTCRPDRDADQCLKDDHGCSTKGNPLIWPTTCVSFALDESHDSLTVQLPNEWSRPAILRAFSKWEAAKCHGLKPSVTFSIPTGVFKCSEAQALTEKPNINIVFFRDDQWPYRGIDGTLASTTVTYNSDGTIWDADMAINAATNRLTTRETPDAQAQFDLESIVLHEAGHFIGLNHSDDPSAVMYASYSPGTIARDLQPDDIEGLCAVYTPSRVALCSPAPRNGLATTCDATTTSPSGCSCQEGALAKSGGGALALFGLCFGIALSRRRPHRRDAGRTAT